VVTGTPLTRAASVVTVDVAMRLRDAGVRWSPQPGDFFVITEVDLLDTPFVLSDMVADVHDFPGGRVIGFNGTVEWALDSVEMERALWLPREDQLRDLLGELFRRLERSSDGYRVVVSVAGAERSVAAGTPVEAYAAALLAVLD
jgi:hypothetical protein